MALEIRLQLALDLRLKILVSVVRFRPAPPRMKSSLLLANVKTAVHTRGRGFLRPWTLPVR